MKRLLILSTILLLGLDAPIQAHYYNLNIIKKSNSGYSAKQSYSSRKDNRNVNTNLAFNSSGGYKLSITANNPYRIIIIIECNNNYNTRVTTCKTTSEKKFIVHQEQELLMKVPIKQGDINYESL